MSSKKPNPAAEAGTDPSFEIAGTHIAPGEARDLVLPVTQSYSGSEVHLPLRVVRASAPGPVLLLTAAVHGDEHNGIGIVRELILNPPFELARGTLVLVPVVNILGFERNTRYLPDRRDLNRNFPGSSDGSLTRRVAHRVFQELVLKSDLIIDFHTAAVGRTNFPNVRADLSHPESRRLARAFGCPLVVDRKGPHGTLSRSAVEVDRAAIVLEAGEVCKVEPSVVEVGLRGVRNVLIELGMAEGVSEPPAYQARIDRYVWLRSDVGGLLRFHVGPGDVVEKGQPIATCATLLGAERGVVRATEDGVIMGLTTLPSVKPGDPVCSLAIPRKGIAHIQKALSGLSQGSLHERLQGDLATSVSVGEPDDEWS